MCLQELPGLKSHDHQAAELLHHAINGLLYASPRSLAITLQHFVRVHEAVASQQQRQQHGSNGGSNGNSSGHGSGACSQLPPTWQLNVTVNGHNVIGVPDLSALKGVMQVGLLTTAHLCSTSTSTSPSSTSSYSSR